MNQQKVGRFLKELRHQKNLTREQLAEVLGMSNRSISRWENGVTMPDLDLLIQLAKFYDVDIGEILDGERKSRAMDEQTEETLLKMQTTAILIKQICPKGCNMYVLQGLSA